MIQRYQVFPHDSNPHGTVFGGKILELADTIAGMVATKHARKICVTLGADSVRFLKPAHLGDMLIFKAKINRVWSTSMEVGVKVIAEDVFKKTKTHILSMYMTFATADHTPISLYTPKTDEEVRRAEDADERKVQRLKLEKQRKEREMLTRTKQKQTK